ncbi:hypothetical protein [Cohnella herbarum]|uniref:Uncharacterized protein n=1 Tax=Cohnella herbarum TaxID=2728023 RepID=A0A7Z2VGT2_9BACL|nr:hypothetical protein [Cohnella herbarum]QJD82918.1 hypothetical protein HH215_06815 [Cohnella herbarum]
MNFQALFNEPIESQISLGGHASDVWLIRTSKEEVVVRASGVREDSDAPFLYGCRTLFGTELNKTFDIEFINVELSKVSPISIPQVKRKQVINDVEFVVVDMMVGKNGSFSNINLEVF